MPLINHFDLIIFVLSNSISIEVIDINVSNSAVTIENNIIAFGIGSCAFYSSGRSSILTSNNNIYGDDYNSSLAQIGQNGNFSVDPLFCNSVYGDYSISKTSSCAPANSVTGQLIGALGVGCSFPAMCADLNYDGSVNTLDITYIVDYYFNGGSSPQESYNGRPKL